MKSFKDLTEYYKKETPLYEECIRSMVGTFIATDSTQFVTISQYMHIPILFPDFLKKGDILCIYTKEGCTIVRYMKSSFKLDVAYSELSELELYNKETAGNHIKNRFFRPVIRTITYSLDDNNVEEGEINNFIDVYLLSPSKNKDGTARTHT